MKYDFGQELREAFLIKRDSKSITLVLDGEEVEISCSELCNMNISGEGSPCLISNNSGSKDEKYSIMAFSLDRLNRENKDWICLKPAIFEEAVGFFIANQQMEEMVSGCKADKGKSNKGKTGPDFAAGNAYIELNIPHAILNAADGGWTQARPLLFNDGKIKKYKNIISDLGCTENRIIFLTVFQHGLNEKMQDWLCREISRHLGMDMDERVEFWVADMRLQPDGIGLLSYQNITGRALLS